jgi:hypothetical protein
MNTLVQGLDDVEPRQAAVSHLALLEGARDDLAGSTTASARFDR